MVKTHVYSKQVVLWSTSSAQWHEKLAMRVPAHRKPKGSESDLHRPHQKTKILARPTRRSYYPATAQRGITDITAGREVCADTPLHVK